MTEKSYSQGGKEIVELYNVNNQGFTLILKLIVKEVFLF